MDHQIGNHKSTVRSLTTALLIFALSTITVSPFHDSSARAQTKPVSGGASAPTVDVVRPAPDANMTSASATAAEGGILVQWRTDPERDNRGFFVYRLRDRQMTLAARVVEPASSERLNSYQWFDPNGTADCNYYIASIGAG